jgi:flagellar biosynthesis chaperone FliJ
MTMHKTILSLAVALFATTATIAQEKTTPALAPVSATNDAVAQQKREISRDLKNTLGNTDNMIHQLKQMSATASEAEQGTYRSRVEGLLEMKKQLTEQLDVVNKATSENSKGTFATAREILTTANKMLDANKSELGGNGGKDPAAK